MNHTITYYNQNAQSFIESTVDVEFTSTQDEFLKHLTQGAFILDFGCGSARDVLYFTRKGFRVDAVDGSSEMCRLASEHTGLNVRQMLFQELDAADTYDGIWACASILHLSYDEIADVFHKMEKALKPGGILYVSFKYGDFEGERNGRYFCDFTEEKLAGILDRIPGLAMIKQWISSDVRPGRQDEKWLNVLMKKK